MFFIIFYIVFPIFSNDFNFPINVFWFFFHTTNFLQILLRTLKLRWRTQIFPRHYMSQSNHIIPPQNLILNNTLFFLSPLTPIQINRPPLLKLLLLLYFRSRTLIHICTIIIIYMFTLIILMIINHFNIIYINMIIISSIIIIVMRIFLISPFIKYIFKKNTLFSTVIHDTLSHKFISKLFQIPKFNHLPLIIFTPFCPRTSSSRSFSWARTDLLPLATSFIPYIMTMQVPHSNSMFYSDITIRSNRI